MKLTKRIAKLDYELTFRMPAKRRRGLIARIERLEAMRKAKHGK